MTRDDVHKAIHNLALATSKAEANRLCDRIGGALLSELDESKFAAVIDAAKAATAKATKRSTSAERRTMADLDPKAIYGHWNEGFVRGNGADYIPEGGA